MATVQQTYAQFLGIKTPPWLNGNWGSAWAYIWGSIVDAVQPQAATDAIDERRIRYASEYALFQAGTDSGIRRGAEETIYAYATRLLGRWDSWRGAGTAYGIKSELAGLGFTATIIEGIASRWWRFAVEITTYPGGVLVPTWTIGDGTYIGEPGKSIGGVSSEAADVIRDTIRRMKSPHSVCQSIKIIKTGSVHYVDGAWAIGDPGINVGGIEYELGALAA